MTSGREFVRAVRRKLAGSGPEPKDADVAAFLGLPTSRLSTLKARPELSALELANTLKRVEEAAQTRVRHSLVRTLVEFFPLDAAPSRRASDAKELFDSTVAGVEHRYRKGLEAELRTKRGVYLFYDSRGRALYAGKAKQQSLWQEMKSAFNRDRADLQTLERVQHPKSNVAFRVAAEKDRKIVARQVPLTELAHYFSAYEVDTDFIDQFEALLIHAFPNDLLNKKKETVHKRPKAEAKTVSKAKTAVAPKPQRARAAG
jgi:hypothetical protein